MANVRRAALALLLAAAACSASDPFLNGPQGPSFSFGPGAIDCECWYDGISARDHSLAHWATGRGAAGCANRPCSCCRRSAAQRSAAARARATRRSTVAPQPLEPPIGHLIGSQLAAYRGPVGHSAQLRVHRAAAAATPRARPAAAARLPAWHQA